MLAWQTTSGAQIWTKKLIRERLEPCRPGVVPHGDQGTEKSFYDNLGLNIFGAQRVYDACFRL